jgi:DNA invertase Pin-like site-specific DNA recombinase
MSAENVPVAQYLRMSTEHQQYSIENQTAAIQRYAEINSFEIVHTYSDPARTGVVLKRRTGLQRLLQDVVSGSAPFRAILVYDVSRWGRFQDTDEAAHYEFVCKEAGVPVHYCAESFSNDGSLPSLVMKALKRAMASEYSRELGVKILAGQRRLAELGFKQGGVAGYGLRRMLLSFDRTPKQLLACGERKSLASDRVILVPGPEDEVRIVRAIYRMLVWEGFTVYRIARLLNRAGVRYAEGSMWDYAAVFSILTERKYIGCHVFGRTTGRLYSKSVKVPKSEWVVTHGAFDPLIDAATFERAQAILQARVINQSNEELLGRLKMLLEREGRLSLSLLKQANDMPSVSAYRSRFGSIRRAYELIGYGHPSDFGPVDLRRRTQALRDELMSKLLKLFPNEISVFHRGGRFRPLLRMRNGRFVSVLVSRPVELWQNTFSWQVDPLRREKTFITLLARLERSKSSFLDYHVIPGIDRTKRFFIRQDDPWLRRGLQLAELSDFSEAVLAVRKHDALARGRITSMR